MTFFYARNMLFDLPKHSAGSMQMLLPHYLRDVEIVYLTMPAVSICSAVLFKG